MKATIRKGCGYWDTTVYPMGGCFKRAQLPLEIQSPEVVQRFDSGAPKIITGKVADRRVAVNADVCDIENGGQQ